MQTTFALVENILLIEDQQVDATMREHQLDGLRALGLSFEHCKSITEGLRRLQNGSITIVLLDLSVSGQVDNVEKIHESFPLIPIVVLTKSNDKDTGIASLNCGAHDYIGLDELDLHSLCRAMNYAIARKQTKVFQNKRGVRNDGESLQTFPASSLRKNIESTFGSSAIHRKLSGEKPAHKALEGEERYRLIVAGVKDYAIFMLDPNGFIESWNEGARRLKGYEEAEIKGKHFSLFYAQEDQQNDIPDAHLRNALERGSFACQGWRLRKDGSRFFTDVVITPLVDAEGLLRGYTKVTRDATESMLVQKEIADARMRLSLALDSAAVGVFDFDLLKNSVWRSLRHDEIFGHQDLLPEWNFEIFAKYIIAEDLPSASESFQQAFNQKSFRMQCRIVRADDKAVRWVSVRAETFRNEQGVPLRMMGTVADITDIKEKQDQQRLLAIMQEREDFMATLTHDMKNPLIGANRLLEMFVDGSFGQFTEQQAEMLQCLKETNAGLLKLIADLIDVYRFEKDVNFLWTSPCDLVKIVSTCVSRISPFAKLRSIEIATQLPEQLPVQVDQGRFERVVQNLLDNALKFSPKGGSICVRLFKSGSDTIVEIEDNGLGISQSEQALLFQRFAQGSAGKRYSAGSGLGLYLCKKIVEAHGGTIECKSEPNRGTIFRVTLPQTVST